MTRTACGGRDDHGVLPVRGLRHPGGRGARHRCSQPVVLLHGTTASPVSWQVRGAAGHGASSTFAGTVLAAGALTVGAGTLLSGRALAAGAVTPADNSVG